MKFDQCDDASATAYSAAIKIRASNNSTTMVRGPQLFGIGADVTLTANLWTDAGLVDGACGRKP